MEQEKQMQSPVAMGYRPVGEQQVVVPGKAVRCDFCRLPKRVLFMYLPRLSSGEVGTIMQELERLRKLYDLEVETCEFSLDGLQEQLDTFDPHILHLWSHGSKGGTLEQFLARHTSASASVVDTVALATQIARGDALQLVLLGVCNQDASDVRSLVAQLGKVGFLRRGAVVSFSDSVGAGLVGDFHIKMYRRICLDDSVDTAFMMSKHCLISVPEESHVNVTTIEKVALIGNSNCKIRVARKGAIGRRKIALIAVGILVVASVIATILGWYFTRDCSNGKMLIVEQSRNLVWSDVYMQEDHRGIAEAVCRVFPCVLVIMIPTKAASFLVIVPDDVSSMVAIWHTQQSDCSLSMEVAYWGPPFSLKVGFDVASFVGVNVTCPEIPLAPQDNSSDLIHVG
jgi:hypothetical protein